MRLVVVLALFMIGLASGAAASTADYFDTVVRRAQETAAQPYRRVAPVADARRFGYDTYRAIGFRPEAVLWRDSPGRFRVEFFPTGFLYETPVRISTLPANAPDAAARPVEPTAGMFDFGTAEPPRGLALAGFKVTYPLHGAKQDEVISFLGASYFRPIGRGQAYGASARGLAIDTALPKAEEFPAFREFWLVEPAAADRALTVFALLESPSAAAAYRFVIRPGARTVVETELRLFLRHGVGLLGIAPLTSMFLSGKAGPARDDFRPEVHDSDGLALVTGQGERIWRPIGNPATLVVSSLQDNNPRGFGLLQRERRFDQYQDLPAAYHARPSLWVEPEGNWGEGEVRLVEIPTPSEVHDNIVAFWVPRWPSGPDKPLHFRYRLSALSDEAVLAGGVARVVAVRHGPLDGAKGRRIVAEFSGGELASLGAEQAVESDVRVSGAKVLRIFVDRAPDSTNRRLFVEIEPEAGRRPVDIRATLTLHGLAITETLNHVVRP